MKFLKKLFKPSWTSKEGRELHLTTKFSDRFYSTTSKYKLVEGTFYKKEYFQDSPGDDLYEEKI